MPPPNTMGNPMGNLGVSGIPGRPTGGAVLSPGQATSQTMMGGEIRSLSTLVSTLAKAVKLFNDLNGVLQRLSHSQALSSLPQKLDRTAGGVARTADATQRMAGVVGGRQSALGTTTAAPTAYGGGVGKGFDVASAFHAARTSASAPSSYGGTTGGGGGRGGVSIGASTVSSDTSTATGLGNKLGVLTGETMDMMNPMSGGIGGLLKMNPLSMALGAVEKIGQLYGSLVEAGMQYTWNRIEGPVGNRNAALQASNVLRPNATFMGLKMEEMFTGLAQRIPVQGSMSDILSAVLSGQDVGAFMKGTPGRAGYFEALRQMQGLTPGVGAGQLGSTLSGYMSNVSSQQRGVYYGGGAFTMMGANGAYKSLAEWAEGITKFFQEQRPGADRGKPFTKDELLAQNFPGSNVNAWFQMMGVPQNMVDYWWQYVMTKAQAGAAGSGPFDVIAESKRQRGIDIAQERLRNITQSARREFTMGTQMYPMYAAREAADRRFNVAMMQTDLSIGQMARTTNAGAAMALMPTPIAEILYPILTKYASSPIGAIASLVGNVFGTDKPTDNSIGSSSGIMDILNKIFGGLGGVIGGATGAIGSAAETIGSAAGTVWDAITPGDPPLVGDYGPYGGTSTRGLTPDLAQRIQAMMQDNPRIKVTSGMRDTVLQNSLRRRGVGRVGPATKSQHVRGWAADLGPSSELGWIQANAHKYGLQTAAGVGEPWHVQRAGTMPLRFGDPEAAQIGDMGNFFGKFAQGMGGLLTGGMFNGGMGINPLGSDLNIWEALIKKFIGGGSLTSLIDNVISIYARLMTLPMAGLAKLFGTQNFAADDTLRNLIDQQANIDVDISTYTGFTPATNPAAGSQVFGDPLSDMWSKGIGGGVANVTPMIFHNTYVIQTGNGSLREHPEAKRVAGQISSLIENDLRGRVELLSR